MRRGTWAALAALFVCGTAWGQGAQITNDILRPTAAIPGASIKFCTEGAAGTCPALANVYTDRTLTTLDADSIIVADARGSFTGYVVPGCYNLQISAAGFTTLTKTVCAPVIDSAPKLNNILFVDGTKYTRDNTGVQAAMTAAASTSGATVYLTDGTYSTLTTTITIPANTQLIVGKTVLSSSASPVINITGTGAVLRGMGRVATRINATGAGANAVNIASGTRGVIVENLRIDGSGTSANAIQIQDNTGNLTLRDLQLNPIGEGVHWVNGPIGGLLIHLENIRVDGATNYSFYFRPDLSSSPITTLIFENTYANGTLGTGVGYEIGGSLGVSFIGTAADNSVIGYNLTGTGVVAVTAVATDVEVMSTAGWQITSEGNLVMLGGMIANCATGLIVNGDLATDTSVFNTRFLGTTGANDVSYSATSTGQHIFAVGAGLLGKAVSVAAGVSVLKLGPTFPFELISSVAGNIMAKFKNTSATGYGVKFVPGADANYGISVSDAADSANMFTVQGTGLVGTYKGIATVSGGLPAEYATVNLTAQGAAISATTLYAVPAAGAGQYRVCFNMKLTQAATTSSVLGGTNGFQLVYTDQDDSVVVTTVAGLAFNSTVVNLALNTTQAQTNGCLLVNAKASTNIQYQVDYTSVGATPMQFNLHIRLEAM